MADTKPCPYCAEDISVTAKKCRYCNEWLEGSSDCHWEGDHLKVAARAMIPVGACWVCAGSEGIALKRKRFVHTPSWVYLGLLGGILPVLIFALIAQRTVHLDLPVCKPCRTRWLLTEIAFAFVIVIGLFAMPFLGAFLGSAAAPAGSLGGLYGFLIGLVLYGAAVVAFKLLVCNKAQISSAYIENDVVTLRVPDPSALRRVLAK